MRRPEPRRPWTLPEPAGPGRRRAVEHGLRRRLRLCQIRRSAPRLRDLRIGDRVRLGGLHLRHRVGVVVCGSGIARPSRLRIRDRAAWVVCGSGIARARVVCGSGISRARVVCGSGIARARVVCGSAIGAALVTCGSGIGVARVACGSAIGLAPAVGRARGSRPSAGRRHEPRTRSVPIADLRAAADLDRALDPAAVHERPVGGAEVLDFELPALQPHGDVAARHLGVVDRQVGILAPDDQFTGHLHRLTLERSAHYPETCHDARRQPSAVAPQPQPADATTRVIPAPDSVPPTCPLRHASKSSPAIAPEPGSTSPTSC